MPLESINGIDLFYEVHGNGPPLVFLHGMTLDHREWDEQVAAFRGGYQVVVYDQRGHGESASPNQYGVEADAADLAALLDHLAIARAHLVGLSRGAAIAVALALRSPARVRSLVLADPYIAGHVFAEQLTDPPYSKVARNQGIEAAKHVWLTAAPAMSRALAKPRLRARVEAMVRAFSGDLWLKGAREPDHLARLGEIRIPTLALSAALEPRDFADVADLAAARISGAHRAVLEGAGHLSNMENPEGFNRLLEEFLESVEHANPGR